MKKYIIIALTLIFAFSSFSLAARLSKNNSYTKASKSTLKLNSNDIAIIDKAIEGRFKNLTKNEKDKLIAFLNDFKNNTSHNSAAESNKPAGRGSNNKSSSGRSGK